VLKSTHESRRLTAPGARMGRFSWKTAVKMELSINGLTYGVPPCRLLEEWKWQIWLK